MPATLHSRVAHRNNVSRREDYECGSMRCESISHSPFWGGDGVYPSMHLPSEVFDKRGQVKPEYHGKVLSNGAYINQSGQPHCSFECWLRACEQG